MTSHPLSGKVRLVGTCFGHQIMARALGGLVGKNPSGRFVLKVEEVHFDVSEMQRLGLLTDAEVRAAFLPLSAPSASESGGSKPLPEADEDTAAESRGGTKSVPLLESHGDAVLELPPGAVRLASSGRRGLCW